MAFHRSAQPIYPLPLQVFNTIHLTVILILFWLRRGIAVCRRNRHRIQIQVRERHRVTTSVIVCTCIRLSIQQFLQVPLYIHDLIIAGSVSTPSVIFLVILIGLRPFNGGRPVLAAINQGQLHRVLVLLPVRGMLCLPGIGSLIRAIAYGVRRLGQHLLHHGIRDLRLSRKRIFYVYMQFIFKEKKSHHHQNYHKNYGSTMLLHTLSSLFNRIEMYTI